MIKILFCCHGNICRSPMAEFVLKDMVKKRGIADQFYIASAATSTEEIWNGVGNPVYPPARDKLREHGISCEGKRAVLLTRQDYEKYDYLIGMDTMNIRNMERMTGHRDKIYMLLQFAGGGASKGRISTGAPSVADPWYTGDFDSTYRDVVAGCEGLLEYLEREGQI